MTRLRILPLFLFLLVFAPFAQAQDATPTPDAQVLGERLRLRAAPSTRSDVLTLLEPSTPLTILSLSLDGAWLEVEIPDGVIGWVAADYVDVFVDLSDKLSVGGTSVGLSPQVVQHIQRTYAEGQRRGNYANVFAKVGDSITVSVLMLHPVGDGVYDLGEYAYLRDVINFYRARETRDQRNSFNDESLAAAVGWTTYRVLNAEESDPELCLPDEMPLLCEYRVLRPSVALIMFGTNDVSTLESANYRHNLSVIVELTEAEGIIPVLSTIPVRLGFEERVQEFNNIIRGVAREYSIPLVDYGAAMQALSDNGLDQDGAHPSVPPRGYAGAADFNPQNLYYGYVLRNLTALQMLDEIWRHTAG